MTSTGGPGGRPGRKSIGWALVQAARLHRTRTGAKLAAIGLFAGQDQVLQALARPGPISMGELATCLKVRPATISKTISRLEALGLVERRAGPGNRRVVSVALTDAGRAKVERIGGIVDEVERELLDGFAAKERRRLRKLLRKAARNLAAANGSDPLTAKPPADDPGEIAAAGLAVADPGSLEAGPAGETPA